MNATTLKLQQKEELRAREKEQFDEKYREWDEQVRSASPIQSRGWLTCTLQRKQLQSQLADLEDTHRQAVSAFNSLVADYQEQVKTLSTKEQSQEGALLVELAEARKLTAKLQDEVEALRQAKESATVQVCMRVHMAFG